MKATPTPKVFYGQRLPDETIKAIKAIAVLWGVSESVAIERAFAQLTEKSDRVAINAPLAVFNAKLSPKRASNNRK